MIAAVNGIEAVLATYAAALCAAAVCWFAIAWGEPRLLIALPLVVGAAVAIARHQRRRDSGETGVPEFEPAPAEVDEWLARLPGMPEPSPTAAPAIAEAPSARPPAAPPSMDAETPGAVYEVREVREQLQRVRLVHAHARRLQHRLARPELQGVAS